MTEGFQITDTYFHDVLISALQGEIDHLKTVHNEATLFSGVRIDSSSGGFYYRFEIPESAYLQNITTFQCRIGTKKPLRFRGFLAAIESQFVTLSFSYDLGEVVPELNVRWDHSVDLQTVIPVLAAAKDSPHNLLSSLYSGEPTANFYDDGLVPPEYPELSNDHAEAFKKILENRTSFLFGPVNSGKAFLLALLALTSAKAGKRTLVIGPDPVASDRLLARILSLQGSTESDVKSRVLFAGSTPARCSSIGKGVLAREIVAQKSADRTSALAAAAAPLRTWYTSRITECLNEEYYDRMNELRFRLREKNKQLEQIAAEIQPLQNAVATIKNASMLDRMKKGFGKEDLLQAQKRLDDKLAGQKRLQNIQQALSSEITRHEMKAPLSSREFKEFQAAAAQIEADGGLEAAERKLDELSERVVIESLEGASIVCTSIGDLFANQSILNSHFDTIVISEAERIAMPLLAAAISLADGRVVVSGDPFQREPVALSRTNLSQLWLQRDIFEYLAQAKSINDLFTWSEQYPQWAILLKAARTQNPKLGAFFTGAIFKDKVIFDAPPTPRGKLFFIDTTEMHSQCKQYIGRKKILPYNELHGQRVVDIVKHALLQPEITPFDIGVCVPMQGATMYTKLRLRMEGIPHIEVGLPRSFQGTRKRVMIFDTTVAGVDYTYKEVDDKKIGEDTLVRDINSALSAATGDLYILADVGHIKSMYRNRIFLELILALQKLSDAPIPNFLQSSRKFDEFEWDKRKNKLSLDNYGAAEVAAKIVEDKPRDHELEIRMKMMAKQEPAKAAAPARNYALEILHAVDRVLGLQADVNLLSGFVGGDLLFRRCLSAESFIARLPHESVSSEREFREVMEQWNVLIYEMSGGNKTDLSYYAKPAPETRVRWDINSLKLYYSSDIEQLIEEGKHQVAVGVAKIFQELLGKSQPASPVEWSTAYLKFLSKMELYFNWIWARVRE